jgi:hypothetical protein
MHCNGVMTYGLKNLHIQSLLKVASLGARVPFATSEASASASGGAKAQSAPARTTHMELEDVISTVLSAVD